MRHDCAVSIVVKNSSIVEYNILMSLSEKVTVVDIYNKLLYFNPFSLPVLWGGFRCPLLEGMVFLVILGKLLTNRKLLILPLLIR